MEDATLLGSIVRIEVPRSGAAASRGTGFVVRIQRDESGTDVIEVLTALHVIADVNTSRKTGKPVWWGATANLQSRAGATAVAFSDAILHHSIAEDWALLRFEVRPPHTLTALSLTVLDDRTGHRHWRAFGYTAVSPVKGEPLTGHVTLAEPGLIHLYCDQAAAGSGGQVSGCSGAPCVVEGHVVGLIGEALQLQKDRLSIHGAMYAYPIAAIAEACGLPLLSSDPLLAKARIFQQAAAIRARLLPFEALTLPIHARARRVALMDVFVLPKVVVARPASDAPPYVHDGETEGEALAPVLADAANPWVFVCGGPGSGKSTLARWICLREDPSGLFAVLIELAEYWKKFRTTGLLTYLAAQSSGQLSAGEVERLATDGRLMWCLDGLDELGDLKARTGAMAQIDQLRRNFPHCRGVLTCRIAAMEGLVTDDFTVCTLRPFNERDVRVFLDRWDALQVSSQRPHIRARIEQRIRSSDAVRQWSKNPLLLTVLVALNDDSDLPKQTGDLYERLLCRLADRWEDEKDEKDEKDENARTLSRSDKREILRRLAWDMSEQGEAQSLIEFIDETRLRDVLQRSLETKHPDGRGTEARVDRLLNALRIRDSVVVWTGSNEFRFAHRTLFEFMIAVAIADAAWSPDRLHRLYTERWAEPTWRNVLTLLPGLLGEVAAVTALRGVWAGLRPFDLSRIHDALRFTLLTLPDRPLTLPATRRLYDLLADVHTELIRHVPTVWVVAALTQGAGRNLPWLGKACTDALATLDAPEPVPDPERYLELAFAAAEIGTRRTVLERALPRAGRAFLMRWVRPLAALGRWTPEEEALLLRHVEGHPDGAVLLASSIPEARVVALRRIPTLAADACRLVLHVVEPDDEEIVAAVFERMLTLAATPDALIAWGQAHFTRWRSHKLVPEILRAMQTPLAATPAHAWTEHHRRWAEFLLGEFQEEAILCLWREDIARRLPLAPDGHPPNVVPAMIALIGRWLPAREAFLEILAQCRAAPVPARNTLNLVRAAAIVVPFKSFLAGLHPTRWAYIQDFASFVEVYRPDGLEALRAMVGQLERHFQLDVAGARQLLVGSLRRLRSVELGGWLDVEIGRVMAESNDVEELVALDSSLREPSTQAALSRLRRQEPARYSQILHSVEGPTPASPDPALLAELEQDGSPRAIPEAFHRAWELGDRAALRRLLARPESHRKCRDLMRVEPDALLRLMDRVEALLDPRE
jgi:hypothetical protein